MLQIFFASGEVATAFGLLMVGVVLHDNFPWRIYAMLGARRCFLLGLLAGVPCISPATRSVIAARV